MRHRRSSPARRAALVGFVIGALLSTAYVLAGGDVWLSVPWWAAVAFYPGFFVGGCVYGWVTESFLLVIPAGCVAVGLEYAAIAIIGAAVLRRLTRPRPVPA